MNDNNKETLRWWFEHATSAIVSALKDTPAANQCCINLALIDDIALRIDLNTHDKIVAIDTQYLIIEQIFKDKSIEIPDVVTDFKRKAIELFKEEEHDAAFAYKSGFMLASVATITIVGILTSVFSKDNKQLPEKTPAPAVLNTDGLKAKSGQDWVEKQVNTPLQR